MSGTSSKSSDLHLYLAAGSSLLLLVVGGTDMGWSSPIMEKLTDSPNNPLGYEISSIDRSWLSSIGMLGALFGAPVFGNLAHYLGRRLVLIMISVPYVTGFFLLAYSHVFWLYLVGRFLTGVSSGASVTVVPFYICELAKPEVRGRLSACVGVMSNLGILLTYCIGPYVSFFWFHQSFVLLPIISFIAIILFSVESPYYYIHTNSRKSEEILRKLRGKFDVDVELNIMRACTSNMSDNTSIIDVLKMRGTIKAILLGFGMVTFSLFSGAVVIGVNTEFIFNKAVGSSSGVTDIIIIGCVQLFVSIFITSFTDKFGRRPLFIISFLGISLSNGLLGTYFYLENNNQQLSNINWLPLVSLIGFVVSYNFAVGPLSIAILGEFYPLNIKTKILGVFGAYSLGSSFLLSFFFQTLQEAINLGPTFWIFSVCSFFGFLFVNTCLIETKGKTLEQIQDEFNKSNNHSC